MPITFRKLLRPIVGLSIIMLFCSGCFDLGLDLNDGEADTPTNNASGSGEGANEPPTADEADGASPDEPAAPSEPDDSMTTDAPEPVTDPPDGPNEPTQTTGGAAEGASGSYGPRAVTCPAGAARVAPGASIQQALKSTGDGTVCVLKGRHRVTSTVSPQPNSTLLFEQGAVLDGSRRITNWTRDGKHWVASGQTQNFDSSGTPCKQNPAACESEDLFRDGKPLTRVLSRSALGNGEFYFDERADRMYVADDPTGHTMEAPVVETAIESRGAHNITVRNATIEKFGDNGIVTSQGWLVADNEIRYVHSHGMRVFGTSKVSGNYIHHAGKMGILSDDGRGQVFEGNQLAYNNYLGFDLWHAGATKISSGTGTVVRNNWSHHNTGDGWWFDWDNIDAVVEGNVFEDNTRFGLFYEASFDAAVLDNTFRKNGSKTGDYGAGVYVNTSKNLEIARNVFEHNTKTLVLIAADRGTSDRHGTRRMANLNAHHNTFIYDKGYVGADNGSTSVYSSGANNRFAANTYIVPDIGGDWWRWGTGSGHRWFDWSEWNAAGQDKTGSISAD